MAQHPKDSREDQRDLASRGMRIQRGSVKIRAISLWLVCSIGAGLVIAPAFVDVVDVDRNRGRLSLGLGQHGFETASFAVSPTGKWVATTDRRGRVALWTRDGEWRIERFLDTTDYCSSVAFSPDGQLLAVGDEDGAGLSLWDLSSEPPVRRVRTALPARKFLAFSPDGRTLAEASNSSADIVVRDLADRRLPITLRGRSTFASVAFSPDGRYLAAGEVSDRSAVFLWKLDNPLQPRLLTGIFGSVTSVAFSTDGRTLATCSSYERGVRLWDFTSGRLLRTTGGHAFGTLAAAFSPDGTTLASVGGDGNARLWNVNTGKLLDVLNGHAPGLNYVAFAAQGRILAAAGLFDNDIRIWQLSVAPQGEKLDLANAHDAGQSVVVDSALFPNPIVPGAQFP